MKAKGHNGKKSDIYKIGDKEYRDHATSAASPPDAVYADNDNSASLFSIKLNTLKASVR